MNKIDEIYKNVIMNGVYDEAYSSNPEIIEGKKHGICLHFSQELIGELRSNGYLAGLISTLNEDGYLHAAVLYKDLSTGVVSIADPVADVRKLTGLTDEQRNSKIETILSEHNWSRVLEEYIEEYGPITEYLDDFTIIRTNVQEPESLKTNLHLIYANEPKHIQRPIEIITNISQIDKLVEDPMKEACKVLYKKGIATECSDNFEQERKIEIFLPYTSLSPENRKILIRLVQENPENFEFRSPGGSWMRQTKLETPKDEYDDSQARGFVIKKRYHEKDTMAQISEILIKLAKQFERQVCMEGVYTREDVLRNIHELESVENLLRNAQNVVLEKPIETSITNEKLARKNGLKYSERFRMFFRGYENKSRYIESLYKEENDTRSNEEIAAANGVFYSEESESFFESEKEYEEFFAERKKEQCITSADIVEATMIRRIPQTIINRVKDFFRRVIEKINGKGEK